MTKTPRLYNAQKLQSGASVTLETAQSHYVFNVMRLRESAVLRLFNSENGEFAAIITGASKKAVTLTIQEQLRAPETLQRRIHLFFAPLKKHRMDMVIEKSVELGVTDLHPIITHHTEVRKLNTDRLNAQIIEAAEQCERLHIPVLHDIQKLPQILAKAPENMTLFATLERHDGVFIDEALASATGDIGFIIGPVGGFDEAETAQMLAHKALTPISLGADILRAETAAIFCLAKAKKH